MSRLSIKKIRDREVASNVNNPDWVKAIAWLTIHVNPELAMPNAIFLWEHGLDDLYTNDLLFRTLYDAWSVGEYAGLSLEDFIEKCGITPSEFPTALIATDPYITLQTQTNKSV